MTLTPGLIDFVLVFVGLEFVVLALVLARGGAGRYITLLGLFLASGGLLFFALRLVMTGQTTLLLAVLLGSFLTHVATIWLAAKALKR